MRTLRRRFTVVALFAATVLGGVAVPGTAYAGGDKFVTLRVCSGSTETVKFYFVGENQFGDWVPSRFWEIAPKGCTTASDYWWKAGQSVEFHHHKNSTGWRWEPRLISYNDTSDGAVYDLWIG
ncbi:hypothetical protein [Streptomyces sp. NPDC058457]|uniref:hypothetical protein n=1 Tax=Streptomyces sp. NPDC058457 TaxID=3346507 RepID=UPI00365932F6